MSSSSSANIYAALARGSKRNARLGRDERMGERLSRDIARLEIRNAKIDGRIIRMQAHVDRLNAKIADLVDKKNTPLRRPRAPLSEEAKARRRARLAEYRGLPKEVRQMRVLENRALKDAREVARVERIRSRAAEANRRAGVRSRPKLSAAEAAELRAAGMSRARKGQYAYRYSADI